MFLIIGHFYIIISIYSFLVKSATKITASRLTVAGEACCSESVSNKNVTGVGILSAPFYKASNGSHDAGKRIRSPDDNDNSLLSSKLLFNASIHSGSTSPSKTNIGQIAY